jgi:hypothetical protein
MVRVVKLRLFRKLPLAIKSVGKPNASLKIYRAKLSNCGKLLKFKIPNIAGNTYVGQVMTRRTVKTLGMTKENGQSASKHQKIFVLVCSSTTKCELARYII